MNVHHTKQKGDLAVFKAQLDLYQQGWWVAIPLTENAPFDLIINKNGVSKTIQVKYSSAKNGAFPANFRASWADKNGSHVTHINKELIDLYCIYCPDTDECYYIDPKQFSNINQVSFRLIVPKNNQTKNVYWAKDYKIVPD